MYFNMKNYLKNTRNHTTKQAAGTDFKTMFSFSQCSKYFRCFT